MKIRKRNGKMVEFDGSKIENAIRKAMNEVGVMSEENLNMCCKIVSEMCYDGIDVESIQDNVVKTLLGLGLSDVANHYISYRAVQSYKREMALKRLYDKMGDIIEFGDNENSNKNYKLPSVKRDTVAGEYFRNKLFEILPKNIADAHRNKAIHWHDSDVDPKLSNCCLFNIEDMLRNGTRVTNADIEQPNSVGTAMNVAMQIMASISASQYGGVSLPNFNEVFSEYAKKNFTKNFLEFYEFMYGCNYEDDLEIDSSNSVLEEKYKRVFDKTKSKTKKDIYDACQLFEYQTNSILGSASQTPFSTITFNIPTSWESEEIISSYLDVRMKGLGKKGTIAIFPKLSMIVVDGYNLKEGDKYYWLLEKASKCIAKTYYPDILNYSKEDYDSGRYFARMGCRSRVNHDYKENGKYQQYSRFNYGVVTLNLPQIALKSLREENCIDAFFRELNTFGYNIIKESLEQRYKFVSKLQAKEAPILFQHGGIARLNPEDTIERLLKTDKASVSYGYIGIDDCVRILSNDEENISTEKGHQLGIKIMNTLCDQVRKMKEETGLPISLYGTPKMCGWV